MKKIILPGLAAGACMLAVSLASDAVMNFAFVSLQLEASNADIFRQWSDPLKYLSLAQPFILGILLAWAWKQVKSILPGDEFSKGAYFGTAYWMLGPFPCMFLSYATLSVSQPMMTSWLLSSFLQGLVAGVIFANMDRVKRRKKSQPETQTQ